jgi:hypothetical protein
VSKSGGPYSRIELNMLNATRAGPPAGIDEISRVYRGDLNGALVWFAAKPMPDAWEANLREHFAINERLVVAFGYPRHHNDFFLVHDLAMRTVVECPMPNRAAPAGTSLPPRTSDS